MYRQVTRFWTVTPEHIIWNGTGTAAGWKGNRDHGYDVERRALDTPAARQQWVEHIAEKTWCSPEAAAEFARIVETLAP